MVNIGNFDANDHEPIGLLPAGWYGMQVVASEVKKTKDGESSLLELEFEMLESMHPELKGRKVWERLNLWNKSAKATEIAQRTLSTLCRSVGILQVTDSDVLHGKPVAVKVKITPAEGQYEEKNAVSGYDAMAARFTAGAPVSVATMTPPDSVTAPPSSTPAPVGHPPAQPAAVPPQGQPGEVDKAPWQ